MWDKRLKGPSVVEIDNQGANGVLSGAYRGVSGKYLRSTPAPEQGEADVEIFLLLHF